MTNRPAMRYSLLLLLLTLVVMFHRVLFGEVFFWGLPALQFYPWRDYAFDLLRQGILPLWNPYNGAGAPLFANYQSALLYPLNWPGYFLPHASAMSVVTVAHLFIAGWGMWAFTGRLGASGLGRALGAFAFGLTTYLVARLGTFPIISAAAWLPWLLWSVWGVVTLFRRRDGAWLALFTGLLLLAGHAQTAWYTLLLTGLFALFAVFAAPDTVMPGRVRWGLILARLLGAAVPVVIGAGIAALQLLATAELLRQSQRSGGVDYDFAMNFSYAPARLLTLISPNLFGTPGDGTYITEGAFFEDAAYIGLIPLVSAIAACFGWLRARRLREGRTVFVTVPFWLLIVVLAIVFALGRYTEVFPFLYRNLPTFNLFQAPVRWHLWTVCALSVLAALGASNWGRGFRTRRWMRRALAACAGAVVVLLLLPVLLPGENFAVLARGLLVAAIFGALAAWLTLRQPEPSTPRYGRWTFTVLLIVAVDMAVAGWGLNPTVPAAFYESDPSAPVAARGYWPQATLDRLQYEIYFRFDDYRYAADNWQSLRTAQLPNLNLLDRRPLLNNFDPLRPGHFVELVRLIEAYNLPLPFLRAAGVDEVLPRARLQVPVEPGLARAWLVDSVCWHTSQESLVAAMTDPAWQPERQVHMLGDGGCSLPLLASDTFARSLVLGDEVTRVQIDVDATRDSWLILADTDYPGWSAYLDGQPVPIYRANLAFRALQVPSGQHTVEFRYEPWWLLPGTLISITSLLLTLLLFQLRDLPRSRTGSDDYVQDHT